MSSEFMPVTGLRGRRTYLFAIAAIAIGALVATRGPERSRFADQYAAELGAVDATNGIDYAEAHTLSRIYCRSYIFFVHFCEKPVLAGDVWTAIVHIGGYMSNPRDVVYVNTRSGALHCDRGPDFATPVEMRADVANNFTRRTW